VSVIWQPVTQTARKEHPCSWCGEAIAKGEEYWRWVWEDRGELVAVKVHLDCRDAWQRDGAEFAEPSEARRGMTMDETAIYETTHPTCEECEREFHAPEATYCNVPYLCPDCARAMKAREKREAEDAD